MVFNQRKRCIGAVVAAAVAAATAAIPAFAASPAVRSAGLAAGSLSASTSTMSAGSRPRAADDDGAADHGYRTSTFVSNLPALNQSPPEFSGVGAIGLIFDSSDHLLVADAVDSGLYRFDARGSTAPVPLSTGNVQTGLAFAKTGQLFAARYQAGDLDEINPASGAFVRRLNPPNKTFPCITALATDPVSGDLFFTQPDAGGGGCAGTPTITRVINPTSPNPTFVTYIMLAPSTFADGLAFGPDGTLYAIVTPPGKGCIARISGTTKPSPPVATTITCMNSNDLFSIAVSADSRTRPTLFTGDRRGTIRTIVRSTSRVHVRTIVAGGVRVDTLIVGPDGCLYATRGAAIDKVSAANGRCSLVPVSVIPHRRTGDAEGA